MQEMWVQSLDQEGPLEEGMATHSSWRIPWTEEPGRLCRVTESAITEATWHAPKQEKTRGSLSFQRLLCKVTSSQAGQLHGDHFMEYHDLTLLLLFFSCSVVSNTLQSRGLQYTQLSCPSLSPRVCSNSCPSSQWCYPTIPNIRVFSELALHIRWPKYWGFSFSISLPMDIQGWFPIGLTGLISLLSKRLSRVFSSTTLPLI